MKTTLEIPDALYRKLKAHAALHGTSVRRIVTAAVERELSRQATDPKKAGWRAVFGTVPASETAKIDKAIEESFEQIDPADWK